MRSEDCEADDRESLKSFMRFAKVMKRESFMRLAQGDEKDDRDAL